jgi:putative oxidoreductase
MVILHKKRSIIMEIKTIIFWVLVTLLAVPSFYFGYLKLSAKQSKIDQFKAWGFPMWFMRALGLVEILSTIALIFPETRIYGIISWAIILLGAIYVNLKNSEPKSEVMIACGVSVQVIFIYLLAYQL